MARLWYRPTPADFVIGLGAQAEMLDENEDSLDPQRFGRAALVPLDSDAFDVYTAADSESLTTDLLDENDQPITQWVTSTEFATLGRGPAIQGPDEFEGDLFLSADGATFYRIIPETNTLFSRIGALEDLESTRELDDLANVDTDGKADGDTLRWDNSLGQWVADSPAGTGTVTSVNGQSPDGAGAVTLTPANVAAATAADMNTVKSNCKVVLKQSGSGYPAKPSGFTYGEYQGTPEPTGPGVVDGDTWLKPASA